MKTKTMIVALSFSLVSAICTGQESSKFMFGVILGTKDVSDVKTLYPTYYTSISEVNCNISESDAKIQLHSYFENLTKSWDSYEYVINYFNSKSDAENFKNRIVSQTKETAKRQASKKLYGYTIVGETNVYVNFKCN